MGLALSQGVGWFNLRSLLSVGGLGMLLGYLIGSYGAQLLQALVLYKLGMNYGYKSVVIALTVWDVSLILMRLPL